MAAFLDVIDFGSLTEPHIPVEIGRRIGFLERPADIAAIDADGNLLDISDQSATHHVDSAEESFLIAALLRTYKEDSITVFAAGVADQLVFFEREREWFLAEDVLAGDECFDGNFDVPVIGSHDADDIDIGAFQDFAIIGTEICLAGSDVWIFVGFGSLAFIDVTESDDVTEAAVTVSIPATHATQSDTADSRSIHGHRIGEGFGGPGERGGSGGRSEHC